VRNDHSGVETRTDSQKPFQPSALPLAGLFFGTTQHGCRSGQRLRIRSELTKRRGINPPQPCWIPQPQPTASGISSLPLLTGRGLLGSSDLHVVTVSDATTAAIYDTLAASGEAVLRLDQSQSIQDLVQKLGTRPPGGALNSLHVYSHGQEGVFWIGGDRVDADLVTGRRDTFKELGSHLHEQGDLLIYGCDVGAGAAGTRLVSTLAEATEADVAASSDLTGSNGGDWDLETSLGVVALPDRDATSRLAAIAGHLSISPGSPVTSASYIDGNGDQVTIELSGPGSFRLWPAGGRTDGADATMLELIGHRRNKQPVGLCDPTAVEHQHRLNRRRSRRAIQPHV